MALITGDMLIEEVVTKYPQTVQVFIKYAIPALVCGDPVWGTVEEVVTENGGDLQLILKELNEVAEKGQRPVFLNVGLNAGPSEPHNKG